MKKITSYLLFILLGIESFSQTDTIIKQIELKEVEISVRSIEKTPVTQTTIKKTEIIKNYIGQDMSYVINKTPSINVYSDNGLYNSYTYFRLRGVDQTRINMTLDGIPLNEPEDQGVYFSNYPDFGANVNSIQIQRGVGTTSYGSSSYIGSINFESPNLQDTNWISLETGSGSYNTYRHSVGYNSGLNKKKIGVYGRYSSMGSDGYRYNVFNESKTFFTSIGYYGGDNILKLTGFSGQSNNGMGYLATNIEDIDKDPRTNYLMKDEQDRFSQSLISLQWISKIDSFSSLNSSIFYNKLDGNYDVLFDTMSNFKLGSDFYGLTMLFNYQKNDIKFQFGSSSTSYNRTHSMSNYPNITNYLYQNTGYKSEISLFTKFYYTLNKLISFIDLQYRTTSFTYVPLGLDNVDWKFFNPKGGLKFIQNDNLSYYLSVGMNHREPTRNDLFNGYDNVIPLNGYQYIGIDTIDIRNIKPERVIDFELGTELKNKNSEFKLNLYYMDFKNEIAQIGQISYIGLPLRKNIKSSFRSGVEFDMYYKIFKFLIISENINYSYNKIKEYTTDFDSITYKNVSPLLTPNIINNTTITFNYRRFNMGISGKYISKSYLDNTQNDKFITPEYLLIDWLAQIYMGNLNIKLSINNMTNKRYFTSGYVSGTSAYYIGAPRNYYISINYKF